MVGRLLYVSSKFGMAEEIKDDFLDFFIVIFSKTDNAKRMNAAYNLPCFYSIYKDSCIGSIDLEDVYAQLAVDDDEEIR